MLRKRCRKDKIVWKNLCVPIKIDNFARKKICCSFMKSIFLFLAFCPGLVFLSSCKNESECRRQLADVEQVIEQYPDSAWQILQKIDSASVADGEEKAIYNLLTTALRYRKYLPVPNDSAIRYSSDYFASNGDAYYQATAYYYHGCVLLELGKRMEAMQMMKKAEESADKTGDELLRNKIWEQLYYINSSTSNLQLAMSYARKFLQSSLIIKDTFSICRAYDDIAVVFLRRNLRDSCRLYREKCRMLAEKAHVKYGRLMTNQASDLMEEGKYEEAKQLLYEANRMEQRSNQFLMLGKIARSEGDTLKARQYLETALRATDRQFDVLIYKELSDLQYEQQNYQESRRMLWLADSLVYVQSDQAQSLPLTLLQQEYDQSIASLEASQRLNRWLAGLLLVIACLSASVIFYLLKARRLKSVLSENVQRYNETLLTISAIESAEKLNRQKISEQENAMDRMNNELSDLNETVIKQNKKLEQQRRKLEQQREKMAESLGRGKELYEKAERAEPLVLFQPSDEQCFIDYFAFTHGERFARLMMAYKTPTRRLATFLILRDMGKNSDEIQHILSVSSTTIRSYKHRLDVKED